MTFGTNQNDKVNIFNNSFDTIPQCSVERICIFAQYNNTPLEYLNKHMLTKLDIRKIINLFLEFEWLHLYLSPL